MITLEQIQEAQSRVNRMIDEFVAQDRAQQTVEYAVPEASLELEPEERYADERILAVLHEVAEIADDNNDFKTFDAVLDMIDELERKQ